jgi:hypothetical protein
LETRRLGEGERRRWGDRETRKKGDWETGGEEVTGRISDK